MKLSLIICAHNEAKLLPDCLRYAVRTGYPWHEIIVVDNASTDETCRAALSGGAIYVREPRKGLPYARQRGFEAATGDILCYVDADTRMPERWPWRVAYRFRTGIDVLCVSGPQLYHDIPSWQNWIVKHVWWGCLARVLYRTTGAMVNGAGFAIRSGAVDFMGGFDTSVEFYGEDTSIARRAAKFGKVLFDFSLTIDTSARRMQQGGWMRTAAVYAANFMRPAITKRHVDYR